PPSPSPASIATRSSCRSRRASAPSSASEPVADGEARADGPGPELVDSDPPVGLELVAEPDLGRGAHGVGDDELVLLLERVGTDERCDLTGQSELLVELAEDARLRCLAALEEAGHQPVPAGRPAALAHEDHLALVLDDRGDDRQGVVVEDEAAAFGRAREPEPLLFHPSFDERT